MRADAMRKVCAAFVVAAALAVPSAASAAGWCTQNDLEGRWMLYAMRTDKAGPAVARCKFIVAADGTIDGGSCVDTENGKQNMTGGSLRLSSGPTCTFTGKFRLGDGLYRFGHATLAQDATLVSGIGTAPKRETFVFTMVRSRPRIVYFPFETVYGDLCTTTEPTPGCTFSSTSGTRINVTQDPDFDRFGNGTNDMWYVQFDGSGRAAVYDDLGRFQYYADVSDFAGYISGTTIGVGTSGLYWENIANGSYWLGRNGVLYSANVGESRYGEAVN
jgi:hypothetical protein